MLIKNSILYCLMEKKWINYIASQNTKAINKKMKGRIEIKYKQCELLVSTRIAIIEIRLTKIIYLESSRWYDG